MLSISPYFIFSYSTYPQFLNMSEYKSFFLSAKLITNIVFPCMLLQKDRNLIITYTLTIVFPILVLSYIYYKKRLYFKRYLCRAFVPSTKLIIFVHIVDSTLMFAFYYALSLLEKRQWLFYAVLISHISISTIIYTVIYSQKERNRTVIAYTRHKYRLGIVSRDIGGKNGLQMGQPVEIVQEIPGGYIVKDSQNNDFQLKTEDIETILNVV